MHQEMSFSAWMMMDHDSISRLREVAAEQSYEGHPAPCDVRINIIPRDGSFFRLPAHRGVLKEKSKVFAEILSEDCVVDQVDIHDCDDPEACAETLLLMYCDDITKRFLNQTAVVERVLRVLQVSVIFGFSEGARSCSEYLEAVPWPEEEEEHIVTVLKSLASHVPVAQILDRAVVQGDRLEKAAFNYFSRHRAFIKLRKQGGIRERLERSELDFTAAEKINQVLPLVAVTDLSRENLHLLLRQSISSMVVLLKKAASMECEKRNLEWVKIAPQAREMQRAVEHLIEQRWGEGLVGLWAEQGELVQLLTDVPVRYRFEASNVTARLCVAVGRRELLAPKAVRNSLLKTWLRRLCDDFGWMVAGKAALHRSMVEEGVRETILTLPWTHQDALLHAWFIWRLKEPDSDSPDLWKALGVWARRSFLRQTKLDDPAVHPLPGE